MGGEMGGVDRRCMMYLGKGVSWRHLGVSI